MYKDLCLKAEFIRLPPVKKVIDCQKRGDAVYLLLKGAVRTFAGIIISIISIISIIIIIITTISIST